MITKKIEPGQILQENGNATNKWKITKLDPPGNGTRFCWAQNIRSDGILKAEKVFGKIDSDDMPVGWNWGAGWTVISEDNASVPAYPKDKMIPAPPDSQSKVMDFFRKSAHPENCPKCGAPLPCNYHK